MLEKSWENILKNRKVFSSLFFLYASISTLAVVFFADDWDEERVWFYGFILLPSFFLYYFSSWLLPQWNRDWPRWNWVFITLLFTGFLWGHFLLVNAFLVPSHKLYGHNLSAEHSPIPLFQPLKKGAFVLYRTRF